MRTTLLASLLSNVAYNLRHQPESLRLYEIGRAYLRDPRGGKDLRPVAEERLHVAGVLWGRRDPRSWTSTDAACDFSDAQGCGRGHVSALSAGELTCRLGRVAPFHPRATAEARVGDTVLGWVGEVHPRVAAHLDAAAGCVRLRAGVRGAGAGGGTVAAVRAPAAVPGGAPGPRGGGAGGDGGGRGARRHPRGGPAAGRGRHRSSTSTRAHLFPRGRRTWPWPSGTGHRTGRSRTPRWPTAHARIVEEVQRRLGGPAEGSVKPSATPAS